MRKNTLSRTLACGLFAVMFATAARGALASQTVVSASGSDSNACTQAAPCATFQKAVNVTASGGEVDALSAGNFGGSGLTIGNPVTIDGRGLGSLGFSSGTYGITINAGATDTVVLRNLSMNGGGTELYAIFFETGGTLVVDGCSISAFAYTAIIGEGANLFVRNTTLVGGLGGIDVNNTNPGGTATLEHVSITGFSNYGISADVPANIIIDDSVITGGSYGVDIPGYAGATVAMIERSTISGASTAGVLVGAGVTSIDSSTFLGNNVAIEATGGGVIRISNNNVYNNRTGFDCPSGGTIDSAGNNRKGSNSGGSAPVCAVIGAITLQ